MTQMAHDLPYLIPEMVVLIAGAGALVFEMLRLSRAALAFAAGGLLLATGLTLPLLGVDTEVFGGTFRIDTLSIWAKLILLPATVLSLLLARAELAGSDREGTVYSLLCFVTFGALVLAGSGDTMFLVLGVLLSSLGAFALVAHPRNDAATEAAMKFFVFASVTGGVMIFGLSYWFGGTGSTLFTDLVHLDKTPLAATIGLAAVITGLGYKASLAPFHFWAPDAYEGAPISVAAYLSVVPKIGAIFALAQVARDLPTTTGWPFVVASVAVLTMSWGYLAALVQENVVRLLAYSSIAQAGYFLLGIAAAGASSLALASLVVFAAAYAAMNLGAFAIIQCTGRTLDAFTGMGRTRPVTGIAMTIFLMSLVGIPPLAGFSGKFLLFGAAIDAHFTWLAFVAILNSVLSLAVYLRIIVPMFRPRDEGGETVVQLHGHMLLIRTVWLIALIVSLGLGLAAQLLLGAID
ncbi:dehydrogenase [Sulfuriferula plumbiphila]|uniref:NADH-quinone oxidoreductase subunit N n=1 Tax=Sulfuriferula plumbiphila TaxID=171865 RepID=A0A512L4W2_9PROT|nr:NADH-quinone oxidoreductase subunit N [Sulfuriferula plumbiphila]BBP03221.1 dehydrogenase [Sulfuriferula plumbiphila]GEP29508.1 dehydrogenase [Sulfuriferula plumbiphila]